MSHRVQNDNDFDVLFDDSDQHIDYYFLIKFAT